MPKPWLVSSITIVSDAPNCGVTYNHHYDNHNSFIIQAPDLTTFDLRKDMVTQYLIESLENEGISAASFCRQVAALVPDMFCNFYLAKNYKIVNNSATTEAI